MKHKAFLVAVNLNQDSAFADLPNTLNDAKEMRRLLIEEPSHFIESEIQEYSGGIARNFNIQSSLKEFLISANAEDVLFLYWAGHGYYNFEEGYLVPLDGSIKQYSSTMIKMTDLREWIDSSPAKAVLAFIDTCHSGSITRGSKELIRGLEVHGSGKMIIAACESYQSAYDRNGHGAFTEYLLNGLSGAAAYEDGIIDAQGLYSFLYRKLKSEFDDQQEPVMYISNLDNAPIEIKRITKRKLKSESIISEKTIVSSSGKSFWLGNILTEYTEFYQENEDVYKIIFDDPHPQLENQLREYSKTKRSIPFSFRNHACLVVINHFKFLDSDRLEIELKRVEGKHEMNNFDGSYSVNGRIVSADQAATLRSKRILLSQPDEIPLMNIFNDSHFIENFINNPSNSSLSETVFNLIPRLQEEGRTHSQIRVICIGNLILTGTVENIEVLNFEIENNKVISVTFKGFRKKQYSNQDPYCIEWIEPI